jgi:predicted dehydrogenase
MEELVVKNERISRRQFVSGAASSAAVTFLPRHMLGGSGYTPPSDKLNIAAIGVGGRGLGDIKEVSSQNIVALCDVDWDKAAKTFKEFPQAKRYHDYRKMLDELDKEVDAVVVATPDHVHAPASMASMKRGKHVYCEKPLTYSVHEAVVLAQAAKKYGVATQMGNQGQASEETRLMCEYIWDGAIGPVSEVHIWTDRPLKGINALRWPQGVERPIDKPPIPDTLKWDLWLGPAPERSYHPDYLPFRWRGWWDFGTGALGDIGCHRMDPVFRALKLGHPTSVEGCCTLVNKETYPVASRITYEFPSRPGFPPLTLHWYDGGMKPPRPAELDDGEEWGTNGILFVGSDGKMLENNLLPEARHREYGPPPKKIDGSNFPDHAGLLAQVVLLGNVALRPELKETLTTTRLLWDAENMKITNLPEANQFLKREYRKGWSL